MVAPSLWPDIAAEVEAGRTGRAVAVAGRRRGGRRRPARDADSLLDVRCPWCSERGPAFVVAGGRWGRRVYCKPCGRPLSGLTPAKVAAVEADTGRPYADNFALVLRLLGGKFKAFAELVGRDEAKSRGRFYLNEAAARWEPGGGSKFSTFATTWVSGRLKRDWTAEKTRNPLVGAAPIGGGDDGVPVAAAGPAPEADRWQRALYAWAEVVLTPAEFDALLAGRAGAGRARRRLLSDVRTKGILEQLRAA